MQNRDWNHLKPALNFPSMTRSPYDLSVLRERAALWRAEAAVATLEAMRSFCLTEADQCERRVHMSLSTPVIREMLDQQRTPVRTRWEY
jgi:hypothetical protein